MQKTTAIAMFAALAAAAMIPAVSAGVTSRTFADVAVGVDFDQGLGLYDPGGPTYCAALISFYTGVSPVAFYYTGVRYFPGVAASVVVPTLGTIAPDPTDCLGALGDPIVPDSLNGGGNLAVDAGVAVWSWNLLGDTQVANLAATKVAFEYCSSPGVTTAGTVGLVVAFTGQLANCLSTPSSYTLYDGSVAPACPSVPVVTANTAIGTLDVDQPIFLTNGAACNTLRGSPAGVDYIAQQCITASLLDTATGIVSPEADSDFFVVAQDGSQLGWVTALGTPLDPMALFPNVSNLESDNGC